jgi:hypothetical protein
MIKSAEGIPNYKYKPRLSKIVEFGVLMNFLRSLIDKLAPIMRIYIIILANVVALPSPYVSYYF